MKFKFNYIEQVWDNLEESYQKQLQITPSLSKVDYLKMLVFYNKDNTGATFYISYLSSEIQKYDNQTLIRYQKLGEVLDNVHEKLKTIPENCIIDNFDNFISDANLDKIASDAKKFDLSKFRILQSKSYVSAKTLLSAGFFSDGVSCSDAHTNIYCLDPNDSDMKVLYNLYDCIALMDRANEIIESGNEFLIKVLAMCVYLGKEKRLLLPMSFINSDCFAEKDEKLICGSNTFELSELSRVSTVVTLSIKNESFSVKLDATCLAASSRSNDVNVFFVR